MSKNISRKKRHHFIPRMYLKGFCDQQGMIWTYHKNDLGKVHKQKPENTAVVKNFYAIHHSDGYIDTNTYEDALADIVETPAIEALEKIRLY